MVGFNWQWVVLALLGLVVFVLAIGWIYRRLRHPGQGCGCEGCGAAGSAVPPRDAQQGLQELDFVAPAIHCEGCASKITESLTKMAGVTGVQVDVEKQTVHVTLDGRPGMEARIVKRLTKLGFPPRG